LDVVEALCADEEPQVCEQRRRVRVEEALHLRSLARRDQAHGRADDDGAQPQPGQRRLEESPIRRLGARHEFALARDYLKLKHIIDLRAAHVAPAAHAAHGERPGDRQTRVVCEHRRRQPCGDGGE
jgi:hypothetical protein